ncbi:hypothetical protein SZ25_00107 [Candidatus Arcanobacter lacustris]|uniref:PIN domain-containing protein n=1 Tax=Candidatus Arcanibacter lacustris TaxID=1607817 RepID=A0A0F5MPR1_9RICK|nr:hypothetical protein SZ25_00107 [Candidatus Arcanobacter lacustris]
MKYLLDTCVLLWALEGNDRKLGKFTTIINDVKNVVFVSIASYWEIMIKKSIGKIEIDGDLFLAVNDSGFLWIDIKIAHIDYINKLPLIHHDPFDRLLLAQSRTEGLKILTRDEKILKYG